MARINTNVPSLIAQANLGRSAAELEVRLERLSTGLRINRGKDDPAGLIISQRINTDLEGIDQAIKNSERASSVISTTEAALAEISNLLNSIKALTVEAANSGAFSDEELAANQNQIDSAIDSITRISNTASFGGLKLLDGSLDYITSGITSSTIRKADISSASLVGSNSLQVDVDVLASAQKAALYWNGDSVAGADGIIISSVTLQIAGVRGVQEFEITSGTTLANVVSSINSRSGFTGIEAALINGDANSGLVFRSIDYGSEEFVSVERIGGPDDPNDDDFTQRLFKYDNNTPIPDITGGFPWATDTNLVNAKRDTGSDVLALVNGSLATGDGLEISLNNPNLSLELLLDETYAIDPSLAVSSFDVIGGGALFQLGQDITIQQQANIGIRGTAATALGGTLVDGAVQFLSSLKDGKANDLRTSEQNRDFTAASDILDAAIDEVAILRGALGAFERNVLDTNKRSLQNQFENLSASRSQIIDADFARETSELTRAQILQSAGTTVLSLANQQSQNVLQLLG